MEQKKSKKTTILIILLIIAIIAICVMAYFIYEINNDRIKKEEQNKEANNTITELENTENNIHSNNTTNTLLTNTVSNSTNTSSNDSISIKEGIYIVEGITVTPDEEDYGIESITISEDNNFSVNFPLGTSYTGTYEIENNILICTATQEINREGGGLSSDPTKEIFEFEIIDSNNLELYKTSNEIFDLTIGMNYVLNN